MNLETVASGEFPKTEGCNLLERKQWEDTRRQARQASALKTTLVLWEASNMTLYHLILSLPSGELT